MHQLFFLLQLLQQSRVFIERAEAHGQAFIQTDNELRYTTVDGIFHGIASEGFAEINIEQIADEEEDPTEDAMAPLLLRLGFFLHVIARARKQEWKFEICDVCMMF